MRCKPLLILKKWRHRPSDCHAGVAPFDYKSGTSVRGRPGASHHARKRLNSLFH
ncbi:IS110 family transposase [Spirosoma agri]|uniref:IS110 family transposase n=1 Tax=Spirosoma agri TaxID=1987381 RepID=UPI0021D32269|nr:IS110 family transposase [Spirosoma agri]